MIRSVIAVIRDLADLAESAHRAAYEKWADDIEQKVADSRAEIEDERKAA